MTNYNNSNDNNNKNSENLNSSTSNSNLVSIINTTTTTTNTAVVNNNNNINLSIYEKHTINTTNEPNHHHQQQQQHNHSSSSPFNHLNTSNSTDHCDMTSLEILNKCHLELFPKKDMVCDDVNCKSFIEQLPILHGEYIQFIGNAAIYFREFTGWIHRAKSPFIFLNSLD